VSATYVVLIVLAIAVAGFVVGRHRAVTQHAGATEKPHSLAHYHGWWVFLLGSLPALLFLIVWSIGSTSYIDTVTTQKLPEQTEQSAIASRALARGMIESLAAGLRQLPDVPADQLPATFADLRPLLAERGVALPSETQDYMIPIAVEMNAMEDRASTIGGTVAILIAVAGVLVAISRIQIRARARNKVERVVLWMLMLASAIAVLTTVGIVFSMLFETIKFFQSVSPLNFLFGTVWDPRFAAADSAGAEGQFGLIPLLAGTLYIALIAMLFAVPIGLMAAIYMAEYATKRVRSIVKPLLEVLAGIPTIVYGFFALVTVGPFLRDLSAAIAGGVSFIQAQSVLTAGLVMGVMLIPFVSSLSDDIITAVPQSMRDGSLGLGATKSETIKRVVVPAALPGIVGALLLTASRAIGETMIVVLAAGVAARLTINPFEAMTTITVKIVNQLTGDLEFTSPQTLVAFALGMTLFVLTLGMNVFALFIVRKYREQYE